MMGEGRVVGTASKLCNSWHVIIVPNAFPLFLTFPLVLSLLVSFDEIGLANKQTNKNFEILPL